MEKPEIDNMAKKTLVAKIPHTNFRSEFCKYLATASAIHQNAFFRHNLGVGVIEKTPPSRFQSLTSLHRV